MVQVLKSLLEFNPYFRVPCHELLGQPVFDKFRDATLEAPPKSSVDTMCDGAGDFDYKNFVDLKFSSAQ